jgi:hypothetical protein
MPRVIGLPRRGKVRIEPVCSAALVSLQNRFSRSPGAFWRREATAEHLNSAVVSLLNHPLE